MKKNSIPHVILVAALLNTAFSVVFIQALKAQEKQSRNLLSLDRTIELLQENLKQQIKKRDPLKVTEDVLLLLKKNGITVEKYQIMGKDVEKVLLIRGKGAVLDVIALFYTMALPEKAFHITYTSLVVNRRGNTVSLVMRVAYA